MNDYELHNALRERGLLREEYDKHFDALSEQLRTRVAILAEALPIYTEEEFAEACQDQWDDGYKDGKLRGAENAERELEREYETKLRDAKKEAYDDGFAAGRNSLLEETKTVPA